MRNMELKLRDLERRRKKRAARLAEMTPEESARHAAWQRAHHPSATDRARNRRDRKAAKRIAEMLKEEAEDGSAVVDVFA